MLLLFNTHVHQLVSYKIIAHRTTQIFILLLYIKIYLLHNLTWMDQDLFFYTFIIHQKNVYSWIYSKIQLTVNPKLIPELLTSSTRMQKRMIKILAKYTQVNNYLFVDNGRKPNVYILEKSVHSQNYIGSHTSKQK